MFLRPMNKGEHKYAYSQSQRLMAQTGSVGHLRGDLGGGKEFHTTWDDHMPRLNTGEFKPELDAVVSALRTDGGIFESLDSLRKFCHGYPESAMDGDGRAFGFRTDTGKYAFLLRLNPCRGEYNFYIYCYVREWLDCHMGEAEKGIRFITGRYKDRFRIPDGDGVRIIAPDGRTEDRSCRYLSDTHFELSGLRDEVYHICQFAELMEAAGKKVIPLRSSLPESCFALDAAAGKIMTVRRGVMGWKPAGARPEGMTPQEGVDRLNEQLSVSRAQASAMAAGALHGWDSPLADPACYDGRGRPKKNTDE